MHRARPQVWLKYLMFNLRCLQQSSHSFRIPSLPIGLTSQSVFFDPAWGSLLRIQRSGRWQRDRERWTGEWEGEEVKTKGTKERERESRTDNIGDREKWRREGGGERLRKWGVTVEGFGYAGREYKVSRKKEDGEVTPSEELCFTVRGWQVRGPGSLKGV